MSFAERVLVVAPHPDDETIGVGGTIAKHAAAGDHVTVAVMTGHGTEEPHPIWSPEHWDVVTAEAQRACDILGVSELLFVDLPAVTLSDMPMWKLNNETSRLLERVKPTVLYAPFINDLHKDHRELFHSLSIAWRPSSATGRNISKIYCYEVQSETHWNIPYVEAGFLPNCWSDITDYLTKKTDALSEYKSQIYSAPHARSINAICALNVWRGSQVGVAAAEGLVAVRLLT